MADTIPNLVSPVGFFVGAPGQLADPSPILADNVDPQTRDFADLFVGADPIDAQVQHALSVIRGSGASVTNDGISNLPAKMTDSYQRQLETSARRALKRLTDNGDIRIKSVSFDLDDPANQTAQMRVVYRNLRTVDAVDSVATIPVPGSINQ